VVYLTTPCVFCILTKQFVYDKIKSDII